MGEPKKVLPMVVDGTLRWFVPEKYLDDQSFELVTIPPESQPKWRIVDAWCSTLQPEERRG